MSQRRVGEQAGRCLRQRLVEIFDDVGDVFVDGPGIRAVFET